MGHPTRCALCHPASGHEKARRDCSGRAGKGKARTVAGHRFSFRVASNGALESCVRRTTCEGSHTSSTNRYRHVGPLRPNDVVLTLRLGYPNMRLARISSVRYDCAEWRDSDLSETYRLHRPHAAVEVQLFKGKRPFICGSGRTLFSSLHDLWLHASRVGLPHLTGLARDHVNDHTLPPTVRADSRLDDRTGFDATGLDTVTAAEQKRLPATALVALQHPVGPLQCLEALDQRCLSIRRGWWNQLKSHLSQSFHASIAALGSLFFGPCESQAPLLHFTK